MVPISMMSAKMATIDILKRGMRNKGYDVITYVHDVANEILSRDSKCIVGGSCDQSLVTLAFIWEKLS